MKFPWTRPREASLVDLADQLSAAQAAHSEAEATVQHAQAQFDDDGTDASARALAKARDSEAYAREYLARAQRLHQAALAREAERERDNLRAQRNQLRAELAPEAIRAAAQPLIDAEVQALIQLARVRALRIEQARQYQHLTHELFSVLQALGERHPGGVVTGHDGVARTTRDNASADLTVLTSPIPVRELLDAHTARLDHDDPQARLLRDLRPSSDSYRYHVPHHGRN